MSIAKSLEFRSYQHKLGFSPRIGYYIPKKEVPGPPAGERYLKIRIYKRKVVVSITRPLRAKSLGHNPNLELNLETKKESRYFIHLNNGESECEKKYIY